MRAHLARGIAVLAVLTAAAGMAPARVGAATNAACGPDWSIVPSPNRSAHDWLSGVTAIASDDAWAVGSFDGGVLTEHWDGSQWAVVPAPTPAPGNFAGLGAVDAVGPDDVWAVGTYQDGYWYSFSEHWDGSSWALVPTPNVLHKTFNALADVVAIPGGEVWAFGSHHPQGIFGYTPVAIRWDGSDWVEMTPPSADWLSRADATGPDDVWVLGSKDRRYTTYHWVGTSWVRVPLEQRSGVYFEDIAVVSPDDAWVAGFRHTGPHNESSVTVTEHWDGVRWSLVPNPHPPDGAYSTLAVVGPDDVWGVGSLYKRSPFRYFTGSEHWDGTAWSFVPTPHVDTSNMLAGADALPNGEVWAVGVDSDTQYGTYSKTLILRACT